MIDTGYVIIKYNRRNVKYKDRLFSNALVVTQINK